jgi:hypothetical protein
VQKIAWDSPLDEIYKFLGPLDDFQKLRVREEYNKIKKANSPGYNRRGFNQLDENLDHLVGKKYLEKDAFSMRHQANVVRKRAFRTMDVIEAPRAQIVSKLAYAGGTASSDAKAAAAVKKEIQVMIGQLNEGLKSAPSKEAALKMRASRKFLASLHVEDATRDAVALIIKNIYGKGTKEQFLFGFRGTANARDIIPDAQIMMNAKKMKRMDEAKAFVEKVLSRFPVDGVSMGRVHLYGEQTSSFFSFFSNFCVTLYRPLSGRVHCGRGPKFSTGF